MADNEIQVITVEADVISEEASATNDSKGVIIGKPYIIITLITILILMLSTAYFVYLDIDNSRAISDYPITVQELEDTKQQLVALEQSVEDYKTTIAEHEKTIAEQKSTISQQEDTISSYKTEIDNYETLLADIAKSNSERRDTASAAQSNGNASANTYSAPAENENVCAAPDCNNSPQRNSYYCYRHECSELGCHEMKANDLCFYCINHKCAMPDCNSGQAYNSYYCYRHKP